MKYAYMNNISSFYTVTARTDKVQQRALQGKITKKFVRAKECGKKHYGPDMRIR